MKFNTEARSSIATKETASLFDGMDNDKDGKISMDELIEGTFGAPLPDEVELPASKDPEQIEEDAKNARDKVREEKKFHAADKNHDGFLDKDELVHVFYPETHPDVMSVSSAEELKHKDKNGDGELSPEEFWERSEEGEDEDILKEQKADFEKLDTDKNGKLNLAELTRWESGQHHFEDAMTGLFEIADEDSDKHLTAQELDTARPVLANSPAISHFVEWHQHYAADHTNEL